MEVFLNEEGRPSRYPSGMYAHWFIKKVLAELEEGIPRQEIRLKYKIVHNTLTYWIQQYGSAKYKNKIKRSSSELKNSVVRAILSGRMTIEEARIACHIKTAETIKIWVKDYQQHENTDLATPNLAELASKKTTVRTSTEQEQIKILQQQLADEKLKVAALNTLIDVAEEQLKINIRKKPGARQS